MIEPCILGTVFPAWEISKEVNQKIAIEIKIWSLKGTEINELFTVAK